MSHGAAAHCKASSDFSGCLREQSDWVGYLIESVLLSETSPNMHDGRSVEVLYPRDCFRRMSKQYQRGEMIKSIENYNWVSFFACIRQQSG